MRNSVYACLNVGYTCGAGYTYQARETRVCRHITWPGTRLTNHSTRNRRQLCAFRRQLRVWRLLRSFTPVMRTGAGKRALEAM
ncbi:hypothetical protein HanRHA438_Chr14g0675831 [Helianthus annuus]|nr:hypothetical protein HanIR_Chr14g0721191 [Helianthus annuus]KAJ0855667.1 hypothetical protein HanRHA438_Chr14g0675831 [Helianthus annuus]